MQKTNTNTKDKYKWQMKYKRHSGAQSATCISQDASSSEGRGPGWWPSICRSPSLDARNVPDDDDDDEDKNNEVWGDGQAFAALRVQMWEMGLMVAMVMMMMTKMMKMMIPTTYSFLQSIFHAFETKTRRMMHFVLEEMWRQGPALDTSGPMLADLLLAMESSPEW